MSDSFDYVIVGGGSAGCVLANRLSARSDVRVALLEAGPDTPPDRTPSSIYSDVHMPDYFKPNRYWTDLEAYSEPLGNQSIDTFIREHTPKRYEQARVMGGGSSVNGQVAARGLPSDYDEWASMGASGWSYQDVLPYLKRLENDVDFDGPFHGKSGPIPIRRVFPPDWSNLSLAFRDALVAGGLAFHEDVHAEFGDGCFPHTKNNLYDHRVSVAAGYLDNSTRRRDNLTILDECFVEGLEFDGDRATGVRVRRHGEVSSIDAGEVIVSAGVMHSPTLLMRAGIGPGEHLQAMGIDVRADRRGVGANLQDHPMCGIGIHIRPEGRLDPIVHNSFQCIARYSSGHDGCAPQDMKVSLSNRFSWSRLGQQLATLQFGPYKVYSRGHVQLASPNPDAEPIVLFNLLSDERDLLRMLDAARFSYDLLMTPAVKSQTYSLFAGMFTSHVRALITKSTWNTALTNIAALLMELGPPARRFVMNFAVDKRFALHDLIHDDVKLQSWIETAVMGDWHACGTCKIGGEDDPTAVVDPQARVYGVRNLRVADASLTPTLPCANTNITTIMIAEKVSDMVLDAR